MFGLSKKTESVDPVECKALLSGLKLFSWMDDDALKHLVGITQIVTMKKNKFLMKEGDKSDSLYVVANGSLRVQEHGKGGADVTLGVVRAGEILGEMALLTGEPRSASAVALEDTKLLQVSRIEFLALEAKTEFLHFKLWCAFALHRCETFLVESEKYAHLSDEARTAWLKKFEISEIKMAEEAPQPETARLAFVAHGLAMIDLKECKAPGLVEIGSKAHVTGAAAHTVVLWLPAP